MTKLEVDRHLCGVRLRGIHTLRDDLVDDGFVLDLALETHAVN